MELTDMQNEAVELVDEVIDHAGQHGWEVGNRGVNDTHAWAELIHQYKDKMQVFYCVDDWEMDNRFIYGSSTFSQEHLKQMLEAATVHQLRGALFVAGFETDYADRYLAGAIERGIPEELTPMPPTVPPTSAAHSDRVPPTDAAHTQSVPPTVPPTADEDAHRRFERDNPTMKRIVPPTGDGDAAHSAAHLDIESIEQAEREVVAAHQQYLDSLDAAHQAHEEDAARDGLGDLTDEDRIWMCDEAKAHLAQAGAPASQQDTYRAVEAQQAMGGRRNWSPVASPLTADELLAKIPGKTITFHNRVSGRRETATVCTGREAVRHTPKITPLGFDTEAAGEDMRIVHFLELGAGFRSIAVSQITEIS